MKKRGAIHFRRALLPSVNNDFWGLGLQWLPKSSR